MMTNIDHLHSVVMGERFGRHQGYTYAWCHFLAGNIELGKDKTIIVILSYMRDIGWLIPMLQDILKEHELELKTITEYKYECNNKTIIFKSNNIKDLRGVRGTTIVFDEMDYSEI